MKARASMKSLELEVGETEEKSKETIAPAENEGLSTDPPLESTKNEPVQPETSPETDPSKTTEQSIPSTSVEIKRRTTPEDELQQLSELLRHAVSQQFNVLRRVRKFMDTVSFLSILYCRWNRKLCALPPNIRSSLVEANHELTTHLEDSTAVLSQEAEEDLPMEKKTSVDLKGKL